MMNCKDLGRYSKIGDTRAQSDQGGLYLLPNEVAVVNSLSTAQ